MSSEQPKPHAAYGFTEREVLWDRIGHGRFEKILADEQTIISDIHLDSNNYGEFLFVTTSRPVGEGSSNVTFFGLGFHEYRDRWLFDDWFWYETSLHNQGATPLPKDEAIAQIRERRTEVLGYAAGQIQSDRGKLFETFADMTDDDGTLADFEDLGDWLDDEFK
jgi:hypothetical protein